MYTYQADVWCDDCAEKIKSETLAECMEANAGLDPDDDRTYDSDEYPKGPFGYEESDSPQHCAGCEEFLENSLTSDGMDYVKDTVREDVATGDLDSVAITEWMPYYDWIDYGDVGKCVDCGDLAILNDVELCEGCAENAEGPVDGDFTITPAGRFGAMSSLGRVEGNWIGQFDSDDDAVREARGIMAAEQYWPNIWIVSDHGNWSIYKDTELVDGDFTITPAGPFGGSSALGRVGGKFIGQFITDDAAVREAQRIMAVEQCQPNIWIGSDHGDFNLYKEDSDNEG